MNVGKSLKMALAKRDMSQAALAKVYGCRPLWISKLANRRQAEGETIERLASCLNMKVSEFLALGED